jgi:hypothetical protein
MDEGLIHHEHICGKHARSTAREMRDYEDFEILKTPGRIKPSGE